jgi:putative flippase GtrA
VLLGAQTILLLNLYAARGLSYLSAVTTTWLLNRRFTFRDAASAAPVTEWLRFTLFNSLGATVNLGTYALMIQSSSEARAYPVLAVACGSLGGLFVNFTLTRVFVFRAQHLQGAAQ